MSGKQKAGLNLEMDDSEAPENYKLGSPSLSAFVKSIDLGSDYAYGGLKARNAAPELFLSGKEIHELAAIFGFFSQKLDEADRVPNPLVTMLEEIRDQARSSLPCDLLPRDLAIFRADRLLTIARKADEALADHQLRKEVE